MGSLHRHRCESVVLSMSFFSTVLFPLLQNDQFLRSYFLKIPLSWKNGNTIYFCSTLLREESRSIWSFVCTGLCSNAP